ncbi:MAG: hypothetical protein V3V01_07885 [Acidimicrobiales bacterium]
MVDDHTKALSAIAKAHDATTMFHGFIYFAPEAAAAYQELGVRGRAGYFASRSAAMGEVPAEVVVATFYNFSPDVVQRAMADVWETTSASDFQLARWSAAVKVFDSWVRPAVGADSVEEAIEIVEPVVAALAWPGRPLAAANAAGLGQLAASAFREDRLLRLWQLVTILREWRGDAHIGLLVAEPLDGAECSVVSEAVAGLAPGAIRSSRGWSESDWATAVERLVERDWASEDGSITATGRQRRADIETRTNELSRQLWGTASEADVNRLGELLAPANKALLQGNYFAAIGRPARSS